MQAITMMAAMTMVALAMVTSVLTDMVVMMKMRSIDADDDDDR